MTRTKLSIVVGAAVALFIAGRFLPLAQWTIDLADTIRGAGLRGVLFFWAVYVVSTVFMLPGSLLTMLAGFAYGPLVGLLVAWPASMTGATVAFLLGRTVMRDWVRRSIATSPRSRGLDEAVGREGFKLVLLLRLSPLVPFNVLNYALSLSSIPLRRYVIASAIGEIPGAWFYVYLGSIVTTGAELTSGASRATPLRTALYAVGFAATAILAIVTTRIANRALKSTATTE
jgi:uncharacterized membrane protein YdjX (TVP38/TMEM64 family)